MDELITNLYLNKSYDKYIIDSATNLRSRYLDSFSSMAHNIDSYRPYISPESVSDLIKRNLTDNFEDVYLINLCYTDFLIDTVIKSEINPLEKIFIISSLVEISRREFFTFDESKKTIKNLSAAKEDGFYFSPPSIVNQMVLNSFKIKSDIQSIIDPACGVGVLPLTALFKFNNINKITFIEKDPFAIYILSKVVDSIVMPRIPSVKIELINGDFFEIYDQIELKSFDLVIMNPPYGIVKFNNSDLTDQTTKAKLVDDDLIKFGYNIRSKKLSKSNYYRNSINLFGVGKGTIELSRLFLSCCVSQLNPFGLLTIISPMSWLGDNSCKNLREYILRRKSISEYWLIPESVSIFKGVNQPLSITFISGRANEVITSKSFSLSNFRYIKNDLYTISYIDLLSILNADYKLPKINSSNLEILKKLQRFPRMKDDKSIVNMRGELDISLHKQFISFEDTGFRLIRGDHIKNCVLLLPTESEKAGFVEFDSFTRAMKSSNKIKYIPRERIAISQCSYLGKKKRIEVAMVPPYSVIGNSCNFILDIDGDELKNFYYYCFLKSSIAEWQFRIFSYNNHVSNGEIGQLHFRSFLKLSSSEKSYLEYLYKRSPKEDKSFGEADMFIAKLFGLTSTEYSNILDSLYEKDENFKY